MKLNVGCGRNPFPGWVNIDRSGNPDIVCDLEDGLPFPDNTFDQIHAEHVLEHIVPILPVMAELWRVAQPGCVFSANVPYAGSDVAYEDPTHVRFFTPIGFTYFSQPVYWRADYGYVGDWKLEEVGLGCHKNLVEEKGEQYFYDNWAYERNLVIELRTVMRAIKPARPPGVGRQDTFEVFLTPINYTTRSLDEE